MIFLQILQTILLIFLVDRNLIIRDRYKIAFEHAHAQTYCKAYFAIWIYCNHGKGYGRYGGKRILYFYYGKKK